METFSTLLAFCVGNSPAPANSPHKRQWRGALMFSLICAWTNSWVNNGNAGDLRRYCAHYDVTVMLRPNGWNRLRSPKLLSRQNAKANERAKTCDQWTAAHMAQPCLCKAQNVTSYEHLNHCALANLLSGNKVFFKMFYQLCSLSTIFHVCVISPVWPWCMWLLKFAIRQQCGLLITVTSQWAWWRLKSTASWWFAQPFVQPKIKENIKAPCHWPLCGEFTGDRWIPLTKGQ